VFAHVKEWNFTVLHNLGKIHTTYEISHHPHIYSNNQGKQFPPMGRSKKKRSVSRPFKVLGLLNLCPRLLSSFFHRAPYMTPSLVSLCYHSVHTILPIFPLCCYATSSKPHICIRMAWMDLMWELRLSLKHGTHSQCLVRRNYAPRRWIYGSSI
jgi:hypothetical protein